jgi:hypothetical protein
MKIKKWKNVPDFTKLNNIYTEGAKYVFSKWKTTYLQRKMINPHHQNEERQTSKYYTALKSEKRARGHSEGGYGVEKICA